MESVNASFSLSLYKCLLSLENKNKNKAMVLWVFSYPLLKLDSNAVMVSLSSGVCSVSLMVAQPEGDVKHKSWSTNKKQHAPRITQDFSSYLEHQILVSTLAYIRAPNSHIYGI